MQTDQIFLHEPDFTIELYYILDGSCHTGLDPVSRENMYYVYILASQRNGTLYTGVTNDLRRRIWEHKHDLLKGFTREYGVHILVYFELAEDIEQAILREKKLKRWRRKWKLELIEAKNPDWKDLYNSFL